MDNDETFFFFFLFLPHNRDDTVAPTETIALSSSSSITPTFLRISRVRAECNRQSSARRTELKCPCFKSLWNSAAVDRVPFLQTDPGAVLSSLQACGVFEAAAHVFVPPPWSHAPPWHSVCVNTGIVHTAHASPVLIE